jgi:hypothetical protein
MDREAMGRREWEMHTGTDWALGRGNQSTFPLEWVDLADRIFRLDGYSIYPYNDYKLWDARNGECIHILDEHTAELSGT